MLLESALSRRFEDGVVHGIFVPEQPQRRSGGRGRGTLENLQTDPLRAPAHLWVVGVISLLWNSFGCYDYTMTMMRDPQTMAAMTPATVAYLEAMPAWLTTFWALGVWGSLAGSILLLARSRHAVMAFAVSLLGLAVSQGYQMMTGRPAEMNGTAMAIFTLVIWGALGFLLLYSRRMAAAGVLK